MTQPAPLLAEIAPTGTLRVALNHGNAVLVRRHADGEPYGITVDHGRELARRLDLPLLFVHYDQAGEVSDALATDAWDVCFLAIEPARATKINFTEPYLLIEGVYLVREESPLRHAAEVDRAGSRIGCITASAYDLFLTRQLKAASLVRAATPAEVFALLRDGQVDSVAGVKPDIEAEARRSQGLRVLPEAFMAIRQAMGTPRGRDAASAYVAAFVDEAKRSGFTAAAFARNGIEGASLAP